jgi:tetratricopeptide (TPR) repeat protein
MRRVLIVAALMLAGCPAPKGGVPRLPAAKPDAVEALKDAARSVRLGPANYERALDKLKAAQQIDPNMWEAWFDEGWLLVKLRRPSEAIAPLERALAILPTSAEVVELYAEACALAGRPGDSIRALKTYLERAGTQAKEPLRVALGAALRRAGKLDDAVEALRQTLRLSPRSAGALNQLGLVYLQKSNLELADLVLHRALDIVDKSDAVRLKAETWNNLGLVALARRRDQEAFAHFEQATKLDPTLTVARRNKAVVFLDCGDYGRAADELKAITKADAGDLDAWVALGVAERGRGNMEQAVRAYEHALDLEPQAPDALYDLGVLNMDFKKSEAKARDNFEAFLKAAPSGHAKRADAEARLKELAAKAQKGAQ